MNDQEFAEKVRNVVLAKKEAKAGMQAIEQVKGNQPGDIKEFATFSAAQEYIDLYQKWQGQLKAAENEHKRIVKEIEILETEIRKAIRLRGVWIKVETGIGTYGVGMYLEAWGGSHNVLVIKPWGERKDSDLQDRTHYP